MHHDMARPFPQQPEQPPQQLARKKPRIAPRPGPARPASDVAPPAVWLLALELRAFWEFGSLLPAWPLLVNAPRGDGHSVIVFPGLSANDVSTVPLRHYLLALGYRSRGWEQGFNFGPRAGVLDEVKSQLVRTFEATGRKVSLIGWSLGGVYARELAKEMPHMVRGVITLGTPFAGSHKSTNAWRIYELASGRKIEREAENYDLPGAPPLPTTSLYSRSDGVVAWQASLQVPDASQPHTENIEVRASHIGLVFNPSAWWAIADRLAQPDGDWKPFSAPAAGLKARLHGVVYPDRD
ncbi:MAG: alpha/beta hydrolase [Polaromonas sp.]|jgi:pimeloyl-ACP methyl ester carboxylesterase|nr:alpha/beta hydrolase [Polaromonas sp.]